MPLRRFLPILSAAGLACGGPPRDLDPAHADALRDSVRQFAVAIARDLAEDGPAAWLRHFERSPAFFMASDGRVVFPDNAAAGATVADLAQQFAAIDLEWVDPRVEPLAPGLAVIASSYRETITDTAGATAAFDGFVTAVARHTDAGWRIRNLHWSSPVPARP
jgi:hypothetical protein